MLQRLVARLLGSAVRRWPAHLRDEVAREWAAEVHALGREAGVAAPVRTWRQLRFAASLAGARPPGADPAPLHWLRQSAPAWTQAGWLLFAPLLAALATPVALVPLRNIPFGWITFTPTSTTAFITQDYLVQAGLAALVGTLLARRFRRQRGEHPASVAGCVWSTLPVIGGLLLVDGLARSASQVWEGGWFAIIAALCLVAMLPPAAAGAAALSRRRLRALAVGVAGLSAIALTLATTWVVVLLAPQTPATAAGEPWWWLAHLYREPLLSVSYNTTGQLPILTVLSVLPGFVLITVVLALAHAVRLARPRSATLATEPAPARVRRDPDAIPAVARGHWWHRTALAGAAYSVLAWAVTLTYLTPNIGVQNSWPSRVGSGGQVLPAEPAGWPDWSTEEGRVWMHELQLFSIVCAALCLLYAAAYVGRPLLPVLAGSAVLLAANMVVVREEWTSPRLLPVLAGGGLLLGIAAWSASTWLGTGRGRPPRPRRLVITITVLAAFLVPGIFLPRFYVREGVQAPPVVLLIVVGLPTILTVLAALGVLATSKRPPRRPFWRLPAALALLPAVGGVLFYQDALFALLPDGGNPFVILIFAAPVALAVPVVVWTTAAIRARPASRWRLGLRLLLAPLLFAAGYPVAMATAQIGSILARALLFPMEYGRAYDGVPYLPGALVLGVLFGYLTAVRLDRAGPELVSAPAPDGFRDLGYARPGPA